MPLLAISHLTKRFGGLVAVRDATFEIEPHEIVGLIGANGAGKSNLISFFKMLNEMMAGRLQAYIGATGRAQSLLHFGPKVTPQIEARLEFEVDNGLDTYVLRLFHAALHSSQRQRRAHELQELPPRCTIRQSICVFGKLAPQSDEKLFVAGQLFETAPEPLAVNRKPRRACCQFMLC